ncbi:hypothetical protein PDENDC454_19663 [Paenibacillus dendritiformis C454]|uniref:Uncharacterized protein n=1 Tax=Paenibacillus dendritiformis C454 TaxID=1131935 RepID=H3SK55_9BACL|nr:hypothetical protein PDENDC454_19663 [Paenibacillus dendritiformis C454]
MEAGIEENAIGGTGKAALPAHSHQFTRRSHGFPVFLMAAVPYASNTEIYHSRYGGQGPRKEGGQWR